MLLTVTLDSYHEITGEGNWDKENKSTIHYRWKEVTFFEINIDKLYFLLYI